MTEPTTTTAERAAAILAGVEYNAVFVPASRAADDWDDDKGRATRIHWQCTFKIGRQQITTPFAQGCGHIPGYSGLRHSLVIVDDAIRAACETGRYVPADCIFDHRAFLKRPLVAPTRDEVLACLITDASALDHPSFDSWCGDYGYDVDSRKAEKIYQACLATGLKLRAMVGDDGLAILRDHYAELGL